MFATFLMTLLAFIPGELVLKNGKLLSYKGTYAVEGSWVKFQSLTDEALQLPLKMVDIEKTKERDAKLLSDSANKNRYAVKKGSFAELVQDTFARDVTIKDESLNPTTEVTPIETLVEDEIYISRIDSEDSENWVTAPSVYSKERQSNRCEDCEEKELERAVEQFDSRVQAGMANALQREYDNLLKRRNDFKQRMYAAKDAAADSGLPYNDDWYIKELENINAQIRQLEARALSLGVSLR